MMMMMTMMMMMCEKSFFAGGGREGREEGRLRERVPRRKQASLLFRKERENLLLLFRYHFTRSLVSSNTFAEKAKRNPAKWSEVVRTSSEERKEHAGA